MMQSSRVAIFTIIAACCDIFLSACISSNLASEWRELDRAERVRCNEVELGDDSLGIDAILISGSNFALLNRERSGERRVRLKSEIDLDKVPDFSKGTSLAIRNDSELIGVFRDSGSGVILTRRDDGADIGILRVNQAAKVIGRLPMRHFDLMAVSAAGDDLVILSNDYGEKSDQVSLSRFNRNNGSDEWRLTLEKVSDQTVLPIKISDSSHVGWITGDRKTAATLHFLSLKEGAQERHKIEWPKELSGMADVQLSATPLAQGWKILIVGNERDFGTKKAIIFDIRKNEQGRSVTDIVGSIDSIENLSVSNPSVFVIGGKSLAVMGNWLDAERTLGTYTFMNEDTSAPPSTRLLGTFPDQAVIESVGLSRSGVLAWTVKQRASYGWTFERCFYQFE